MIIDETITSIIIEIREELKEERGIELSEQEIFELANSQFIGAAFAVSRGISFFISYIANFVFKNKKDYISSVESINKLKSKVSDKEYKEIIKKKKMVNKDTMNASTYKLITELSEIPDSISENVTISKYNEFHNKLIENE